MDAKLAQPSSPPPYLEKFWLVIAHIPSGKVATYGGVAAMAGYPRMARAVGRCLKQLPEGSSLPWHRVINAQGLISFPEGSAKYQKQRQRLQEEGIVFRHQRVPLKQYLWLGD
ncbi:MGMT family protein [Agarivorans sp. QJM3NY_25]|uniref:MGMT family protein n=1 Tax=Agarivorans sp. QJM3NY_25 TaxID=3421430 RepID=UPI003D7EA107